MLLWICHHLRYSGRNEVQGFSTVLNAENFLPHWPQVQACKLSIRPVGKPQLTVTANFNYITFKAKKMPKHFRHFTNTLTVGTKSRINVTLVSVWITSLFTHTPVTVKPAVKPVALGSSCHTNSPADGIAQFLGCRSLASRVSLTWARSMVDKLINCPLCQLSLPSLHAW